MKSDVCSLPYFVDGKWRHVALMHIFLQKRNQFCLLSNTDMELGVARSGVTFVRGWSVNDAL